MGRTVAGIQGARARGAEARGRPHALRRARDARGAQARGTVDQAGEGVKTVSRRAAMRPGVMVRIHAGEPLKLDVSIVSFTGDPNSTLELAARLRPTSEWPTTADH